MATEYKRQVVKNPNDSDATIDTVLNVVEKQTRYGDRLLKHTVGKTRVTLTFEGT